MNFKDKDGMLHHIRDPEQFSSENWQMFTGLYIIMKGLLDEDLDHKTRAAYQKRMIDHKKYGGKLSHDNRTAFEMSMLRPYQPEFYKLKDRLWLHPKEWITYLGVQLGWKWMGTLLFPFHYITIKQETKERNGNVMFKTDGKILALARMTYFGSYRQLAFFTEMLKNNNNFGSWYGVFRRYFCQNKLYKEDYPEGVNHPLVKYALELDGKLGIYDSVDKYEQNCLNK